MGEVTTESVINELSNDMSDVGEVNDFNDFNDVDISDLKSSAEGSEEEAKEDVSEDDESGDNKSEKIEESKEELKLESKEEKEPKEEIESKMLEAEIGEEAVKIDPNTVFTHKVDGKEVKVTAQELLNDYSGQKSWNKKFSELGEEKRVYTAEKGELLSKVDTFVDAVNKADAVKALDSLAALANSNPVELRKHFIDLMKDQAMAYVQMSPEQQKELDNSVNTKYHEDRNQFLENKLVAKTEYEDLTNQISGLQRKYAISDERLIEIHDEIQDKSNLSIEALEDAISNGSYKDKASSLLSTIDPSLKENNGYVSEISKFIKQNPDLSDEEVSDSIKEALKGLESKEDTKQETSASKKLQKKINKAKPQENNQSFNDDLDDVVDFDDVTF